MRRNLTPADLGDLLDRPLNAVLAVYRKDGTVLLTPVWHRWDGERFAIEIPANDRKIAMLERDPRVSLIVAENEHPYRAIEVRGRAVLSRDDYQSEGRAIAVRYDPSRPDDYLSAEAGVIVRVDAEATRAWDYSDDDFY